MQSLTDSYTSAVTHTLETVEVTTLLDIKHSSAFAVAWEGCSGLKAFNLLLVLPVTSRKPQVLYFMGSGK